MENDWREIDFFSDESLVENPYPYFEQLRSAERKELFGRIDALSAELVRRYRDGEADVDGLLDDDDA